MKNDQKYLVFGGIAFLIFIGIAQLSKNNGGFWEDDGTRMSCVDERRIGPLYAAIDYTNTCSENLRVVICSKTFVGELWNALVHGRADGGDWSCRRRLVRANSHIDNRMLAGEQSGVGRIALSEVNYRLFACAASYEVRVTDTEEGRFRCVQR